MSEKSDSSATEEVVLNPVLCAIALAVISGLAALTAGLPLNLPSHQVYEDPASLDRGDTAWMLISTVLGLFLAPAIANLYATMHNDHTTRNIQLVLLTGSMITFVWILFTYSLCYGKDVGKFLGNPDTFYMFSNTYGQAASHIGASTIPSSIASMYELCFALVTPAIVASSLGDRVSTFGFLLFILVWHICVYCPLVHMMWAHQGWFQQYYVEDFSGGLVVHMLGAHTALCVHTFLGRDKLVPPHPVHDANAVLKATFIVWFLWFGFSAGKAHNAGPVAAQSVVNVITATMASVLSSFFYELIFERNITPVSVSTAVLLGLVGITPASGYVTVGGAMVIGIATYGVTILVSNHLNIEGLRTNAPISVVSLHGVGGATGFLATAILSYQFINPDAFDGATWGNGWPILYHLILLCLFYICTTAVIALILFVCNFIAPLQSTVLPEGEYPAFSIVTKEMSEEEAAEAAGAEDGRGMPARARSQASRRVDSQRFTSDGTGVGGKELELTQTPSTTFH